MIGTVVNDPIKLASTLLASICTAAVHSAAPHHWRKFLCKDSVDLQLVVYDIGQLALTVVVRSMRPVLCKVQLLAMYKLVLSVTIKAAGFYLALRRPLAQQRA
jgi:hypothetical protein